MKTHIIVSLSVFLLFLACGKSAEVVVVDDNTNILPSNNPATTQTKTPTPVVDNFNKIVIGEPANILTLDPLFATTSSELRVISLIYDGLTSFGKNGNIEPAIAKKWTTTRDSLTYTFTLNENAIYHSSKYIPGWHSRPVSPNDVINVFKRMGKISVPHHAASLFGTIDGFKPYTLEQTQIKNPAARVINSIKGISSPNDSTVIFKLNKPDANFIKNLAHPWASIYPTKSLPTNNSPIQNPVGTGSFYLDQKQSNTLILASFENAFNKKSIPDRVDIVYGKNERDLYQDFAKGTLDALVEVTPAIFKQVTDSTGSLDVIFSNAFNLTTQNTNRPITLNYNPSSNTDQVYEFLASSNAIPSFDASLGTIKYATQQSFNKPLPKQTITFSFTEDPTELYLINIIGNTLSSNNNTVVLSSSYAMADVVSFSMQQFNNAQPVLTWQYPVHILSHKTVTGIKISQTYWNISFDGATQNQQ